jgi:hypothetical protein
MRGVLNLIAITLSGIFAYALPGLAQSALIGKNLSPWFCCVVLGDLVGCAIIFAMGYRRIAPAIYLLCTVIEAIVFSRHVLAPEQLVWTTNAIPAVIVAAILIKAGMRNLRMEE